MSFLTPLYLAGLLAMSLPLLFHLIRRTPRGRFSFSSLMFLSPSPPRLTRRSRLDNVLLLLLRAAALLLLAAAFARPFLRLAAEFGFTGIGGRRVAILVDTSASMQRAGVWPQARQAVHKVLDDLGPGDDVALYRFDSGLAKLVEWDDLPPREPAQKAARVKAALATLVPGWGESNLGEALIAVSDDLGKAGDAGQAASRTERQIVLVSDLQEGSRIEALRTYQWPNEVQLTVHTVTPAAVTNAGLHTAAVVDEAAARKRDQEIRVRVSNDRRSLGEQFELRWEMPSGPTPNVQPVRVYVPPGENRIVRVPRPNAGGRADRLVLTGDDHPFDNVLYAVPIRQEEIPVVCLGNDAADDPAGMRYYLERAWPDTAWRRVRWVAAKPETLGTSNDLLAARLVVVTSGLQEKDAPPLRDHLQRGGTVFLVLPDAASTKGLAVLMGLNQLAAVEATTKDYAMFGQIDFAHPLFAPLADPRFNDFTKVHFWKHRRVDLPIEGLRVLARFDDGAPAFFEQAQAMGRLLVLTAGWHPADSTLARSTKFVPILSAVLEQATGRAIEVPQYDVGDPVALPDIYVPTLGQVPQPAGTEVDAIMNKRRGSAATREAWSVRVPGKGQVVLGESARIFDETNVPGVYEFVFGQQRQPFAVNVAAAESRTDPLDAEQLQEWGVRLGRRATRAELAEQIRQMRDVELERQQKLWRRLIAAALVILILETWLAGYLSRIGAAVPTMADESR